MSESTGSFGPGAILAPTWAWGSELYAPSHAGDDGDGGDGGDGSDELPTMSTDELMLGALAEAFMLKRYGEQNAVASLEKELVSFERRLLKEGTRAPTLPIRCCTC